MSNVLWLHPDLGIGGAERFLVDVVKSLHDRNIDVDIVVNHYNEEYSFYDTKTFRIHKIASFIPRHIFNKFHAIFAYFKMSLLAIWCALHFRNKRIHTIVVDQVTTPLPVLKWFFPESHLIFYCHFPDSLLSSQKNMYRRLLHMIEDKCAAYADDIFVNSKFTQMRAQVQFSVSKELRVVYPFVAKQQESNNVIFDLDVPVFLSINRLDPTKKHELAILSTDILNKRFGIPSKLVIIGGYDKRIHKQVKYKHLLEQLANDLKVDLQILTNATDDIKQKKIKECIGVLYTPPNEHFGLIPLECMQQGRMVIVQSNGGPAEILQDHALISEGSPYTFAECMCTLVKNHGMKNEVAAAQKWIEKTFTIENLHDKMFPNMFQKTKVIEYH